MKVVPIKITAKLWIWEGKGAWHFVTIQKSDADILIDQYMWPRRGFGSIPVNVIIGESKWKTSIFPQKSGTFILPIKKTVRQKEQLILDEATPITIEVIN